MMGVERLLHASQLRRAYVQCLKINSGNEKVAVGRKYASYYIYKST